MPDPTFFFDSSSCSGCKACQVACKDKHDLPVGMLWRRVYEVSGGGWRQEGAAWISDAYAYNLSISCNHCQQPTCVETCPTTALYKRPDGLVLIEPARCIGCKYCTWACPYGAPQYDPDNRVMTKCTGCEDYLALGLPPACVAACPLRVLDFGDQQMLQTRYTTSGNGLVQSVAPLPKRELTQPGLLIRPHRDSLRATVGTPRLANLEEVHTAPPHKELPLAWFTVLAQMVLGAFITLGLFRMPFPAARTALPVLMVGVIMMAALLLSLLHLGQPQRAYWAIANWRTSWLSREILFAGTFTGGVFLFNLLQWLFPQRSPEQVSGIYWLRPFPLQNLIFYLTALAGLALVYSMARVYRLRTVPVWDHWRTTASFFTTAFLLGPLLASLLLFLQRRPDLDFYFLISDPVLLTITLWSAYVALLASIVQGFLTQAERTTNQHLTTWRLRMGLLLASALVILLIPLQLAQGSYPTNWIITGVALAVSLCFSLPSELLGRWMFYEKKAHSGL